MKHHAVGLILTVLALATGVMAQEERLNPVKEGKPVSTVAIPNDAVQWTITASELLTTSSRCYMTGNAPPTWLGSEAGITSKVLHPWIPIEAHKVEDGLRVDTWGRSYEFGDRSFVRRIDTKGAQVLSRPVGLTARVDGVNVEWEAGSTRIDNHIPSQVSLTTCFSGESLDITCKTVIEYDGMMRMDWRIAPKRSVTLDKLVFEVPVKREYARYLYSFFGRSHFTGAGSWRLTTPGGMPESGYASDFRPFLWLGDEDRGLSWFCESDKNWYNEETDRIIQVIPQDEEVVVRLNLVSTLLHLSPDAPVSGGDRMVSPDEGPLGDLSYTFGLQATPVKPVEKDVWDYRLFHFASDTLDGVRLRVPEEQLDKLASAGVRTIAFHEHWTDYEAYYDTEYREDLRYLVEECHKRGMQLLLYFGYLISDLCPEYPVMGDQVVLKPVDRGSYIPYNYPPQPLQNAYMVCLQSIWQDAVVDGIDRLIDRYDIDGVYLDGTAYPWACANRAHGCGYIRPDGSTGLTYPIFAVRQAMRRIHTVVKERKPDGQINVHNSTCMTIPTLAWATSYWDGEQFAYVGKDENVLESLPLDAFRCEFMGRQWGIPAEFLADVRGKFRHQESYAITLLHDVLIRCAGIDIPGLEIESRLWRLSDEFGRKEAEWLPYWRNSDYVGIGPDNAFCSLYRHPENGVLAVISNLNLSEMDVKTEFNLEKLGLSDSSVAHDAFTREPVTMVSGQVNLSLPPLGWKVLWLKRKGS